MIVAFTGIRDIDPRSTDIVARAVESEFIAEPIEMRFGGALGADTYALAAAHARRPFESPTKLVVVVPFRLSDQPRAARELAQHCADHVRELNRPRNYRVAYHERNEALVDGANRLVAFSDGRTRGGTYHTICAARRRQLEIVVVRVQSLR